MEPPSILKIFSEDIADFYPAFEASVERGCTNVLGKAYKTDIFAGTFALKEFLWRRKSLGLNLPGKVLCANRGLVMGDVNAADFAVAAHAFIMQRWSPP